jgi:hypothetical protein
MGRKSLISAAVFLRQAPVTIAVGSLKRAGENPLRNPERKFRAIGEGWARAEPVWGMLWLTIGYHLCQIRRVECASFDGKTIVPNWNS